MFHYSFVLTVCTVFMFFFFRPVNSAELLMVESEGCEWCELWDKEIGSVYSKTREGKYAPLRRVDISDMLSTKQIKIRLPNFTPTFVVLDDGREVARIIGYPGEDFFWPMLNEELKKTGYKTDN